MKTKKTAFQFDRENGTINAYEGWTARELSRVVPGTCFDGHETRTSIVTDGISYRGGRRKPGFPKAR